jgi:hypothetical protein
MASETFRRIFLGAVGTATAARSEAPEMKKVTGVGGLVFTDLRQVSSPVTVRGRTHVAISITHCPSE